MNGHSHPAVNQTASAGDKASLAELVVGPSWSARGGADKAPLNLPRYPVPRGAKAIFSVTLRRPGKSSWAFHRRIRWN